METFYIEDLRSLTRIARSFLEYNKDNRIFAFFGELGSGKTTFIKAVCNELNVIDIVSSPTFSLVNEYRNEKGDSIYHMDFYRINSASEALDIGIEDYFNSTSYCFIEWAEKID